MRRKIKQFVSFYVVRITNKYIRFGTRVKLRTISRDGRNKTKTTYDPKMRETRRSGKKTIIWSFI
jgi:hypothetical protein